MSIRTSSLFLLLAVTCASITLASAPQAWAQAASVAAWGQVCGTHAASVEASPACGQRVITAAACASKDFKLRDYNLGIEECASSFSSAAPVPVSRSELLKNRAECRDERRVALVTCSSRHAPRSRSGSFCRRAVKSELRACLYQARFAEFVAPGPQQFRRDTCAAARSGLAEICFDYRTRRGLGSTGGNGGLGKPQPLATKEAAPMASPTPTPSSCTETCVENCVDQYYEDYDYNAEQLCYYDKCDC